ncbi:BLUF domain-containing protein [Altererythrobacter sp. GH1-8]|uniref:BLUF domain-containing protein n=1 Tax=Altererythrobacter sp. GH1-8 TaxID=3349333 RepID=UPI00374DF7DB
MEQLIYSSIASPDLSGGDIFEIVSKAAVKNRDLEVTGMLAVAKGRFFQALEGPGGELDALMARIERDRRHHSLTVLSRRKSGARLFPRWSMQRFDIDDEEEARRRIFELIGSQADAKAVLACFTAFLNKAYEARD